MVNRSLRKTNKNNHHVPTHFSSVWPQAQEGPHLISRFCNKLGSLNFLTEEETALEKLSDWTNRDLTRV